MLPPQSWGTFPNHVHRSCWRWLCSARWFFWVFFFSYQELWTVLLWENRLGQIAYYSFLLCCQRCWSGSVSHNIPKTWVFTHFGSIYEGGHAPCPPPSTLESSSSNSNQKKHLETDPESSLEWNRHQTLLISAVAGLRQTELGWTTHISFSVKITCTTLLSPSYCTKQAPSDSKRGDLLMPQLRDGAHINHFSSSFLNAWKIHFSQWEKTPSHMFRSICFFSEVNTGIEWLFFLQKNMMQGFFTFFTGLRQKEKHKKKHSWNAQIWNFLF